MDYPPSFILDDEREAAKKLVEQPGGDWDYIHTVEYYHEPTLWEKFKGLFKKHD